MASGVVKRVIQDRQFGFIRADDGEDFFFHKSAVRFGSFEALEAGVSRVDFDIGASAKGPRAENVRVLEG